MASAVANGESLFGNSPASALPTRRISPGGGYPSPHSSLGGGDVGVNHPGWPGEDVDKGNGGNASESESESDFHPKVKADVASLPIGEDDEDETSGGAPLLRTVG